LPIHRLYATKDRITRFLRVFGKVMVGASEHIYDTEFKDVVQTLARAGFLELNAVSRLTVQASSHQDGS
jgi:hypothetical protein